MKKVLFLFATIIAMNATAQTDWKKFDQLMYDDSYKSAFQYAEKVYKSSTVSAERLAAAYHMALAAARYQEDARDSAEARYKDLLPSLDPLEKALCHSFLGQYDSALTYAEVLKATPVKEIKMYCEGYSTNIVTPTAYDVVMLQAQQVRTVTPQQRVDMQRQLVDFHASDTDMVRLWHELRLLTLRDAVPNHPLGLHDYEALLEKYRGTSDGQYTEFYHRMASHFSEKGDYVKALTYCDSAIALDPDSKGAIACSNVKGEILQKRVSVEEDGLVVYPGAVSLQRVRHRNLDHLWFRVIDYFDSYRWGDENLKKMVSSKPIAAWDLAVGTDEARRLYNYEESYFTLPALKTGHYLLLVSSSADFKTDGLMAYEVNCTDLLLVYNGQRGILMDRRTGQPIVGQKLKVIERDYQHNKVLETVTTDADGRYTFSNLANTWNTRIYVERDGFTQDVSYSLNSKNTRYYNTRCSVHTDRPIYRPGETVQAALLLYKTNGLEATAIPATELVVTLTDPNNEPVDTLTLTTDDYGVAHGEFTLPTDRLPGNYRLQIKEGEHSYSSGAIRVEEYKQPKFLVSMEPRRGAIPAFGQEIAVQGLAASYSNVPVSGARVQYTVNRRAIVYRWWYGWDEDDKADIVAEGEIVTAADGSFVIPFVPEPDSNVELSRKPTFLYTVTAIVTDLNGESHQAVTSLRVGYRNAFLSCAEGNADRTEWSKVGVTLCDINGSPLEGKVNVRVERLVTPTRPLLTHPLWQEGTLHTMGEEEWGTTFPLFSREEVTAANWEVAEHIITKTLTMQDGEGTLALPQLKSGTYRVTLTSDGAEEVVTHVTLTLPDEKKVQTCDLLWAEVDRSTAEVGQTVHLRFGSRFQKVEVYYTMRQGDQLLDFRRMQLNDEMVYIDIPVDNSLLGDFQIDLMTIQEGVEKHWSRRITVPFKHKELKVDIATFRDKLLPGEQEEWTITVKDHEVGTESALILTMFDDALNSYGSLSYSFYPWTSYWSPSISTCSISGSSASWWENYKHRYYYGGEPSVWSFKDAMPRYRHREMRMYRGNTRAKGVVYEEAMLAACVTDMEDAVELQKNVLVVEEAEEAAVETSQENQMRTNLNTLAFFAPDLRTDADGSVTYRFTMPELLTRWNVHGLAFTKDLKMGTLDRTLITQKPLMVQPNIPRFLRSGDALSLMAKVVASEQWPEAREVEVSFLLTDAATGDTLCNEVQHIRLQNAARVMFNVEVPQNVYVATYKILATCHTPEGTLGDGEQGQLPVVTNRQAVTVSQALYINGAGEKRFSMPEWLVNNGSREPLLLGAEVVSNPIWLAIKCMPYFESLENPSATYLANQLYINLKGKEILNDIKDLKDFDDLKGTPSRLTMNEDVKQTLLKATPWVREARAEENQMAAVANYFDAERIARQLEQTVDQLKDRQNRDGGWSWMPKGESSVWVTQQVLKDLVPCESTMGKQVSKALSYIDREQQQYYVRYIKPLLKKGYHWQPTDIDYLYTRSFYGDAKTEAYKVYYSNALKNYKEVSNLYTQAQLALIFYRHGDKKQALDLLRRLKEKSLESDEMGLYWRDNLSSWWWYQRPVETQALLIQAFAEITPKDTQTIGLMQQWLLKQKQTTHWGNDAATTKAIDALMVNSPSPAIQTIPASLTVFGTPMTTEATGLEGYRTQRWTGAALDSVRALANDDIVVSKQDDGIAWGAVYYQFTDDMDRIPSSEMGIKISRRYEVGSQTSDLQAPTSLKVGDKVKVRIDIQCDRAMEYLEIIDGRPSCFEPLSTQAGWCWNDGLRYYVTVNNTDTRCYVDRLDKGKYYLEYEVFVTNPGQFLTGPATMQCMYAPEFRATAPAQTLVVRE